MEKAFTLTQAGNALDASSKRIATVAKTAAEAITEVDDAKADKISATSVLLTTTGWHKGSGEYPYYYDIADSSVTAADRVDVILLASDTVAKKCGFDTKTCTYAGYIRIRAKTAPTEVISAEYQKIGGK